MPEATARATLVVLTIQSASAAIKAYECAMSYSDVEQQHMDTMSAPRLSAYWRADAAAEPDMEAAGERLAELCTAQAAVQKAAAAVSATILYNTVMGYAEPEPRKLTALEAILCYESSMQYAAPTPSKPTALEAVLCYESANAYATPNPAKPTPVEAVIAFEASMAYASPAAPKPTALEAILAYNFSMGYASAVPQAISPCAAARDYNDSMAYASPSAPPLPAGKRASLDVVRVVDVVAATA